MMLAQMIVWPWHMPANLKFLMVMALVTPMLPLTCRYGVRYTAIGILLNGPRRASPAG